MSLESYLDRVADDIDKDRRISSTIYCGKCGYDLRTLPYLYQCPECGNDYNARPLVMKGVFMPVRTPVPWIDMLAVPFFGYVAYTFISESIPVRAYVSLAIGAVAAGLGLAYLLMTIAKWKMLIRNHVLLRRIERANRENDASL